MKWSFAIALILTGCSGFGSEDDSVMSAVPDHPGFNDIARINATYCVRCHNATNIQGDFQGDTYDTLYAKRHDIEGEIDQGLMPPLSEPPMAKLDRETFLKWLRQGAQNNFDDAEGPAGGD